MMLLAAKERTHLEQMDQALQRRAFEILSGGLETRTRAMLKVQDGCNNFARTASSLMLAALSAQSLWTPPSPKPGRWRPQATGKL